MREEYQLRESQSPVLSVAERPMTEVHSLMAARRPDGSYDPQILADVHANMVTGILEAAMPLAISPSYQEYRDGDFIWRDGQTPAMVARSGYSYHKHEAAFLRVDVEVDEAELTTPRTLAPGFLRLMITPAMSDTDASREIAEAEHLADNDMLRIHKVDVDDEGRIRGKHMPTVMLPRVPLPVWHATAHDLGALIGKQFPQLEGNTSALSLMKLHNELNFPEESLPEGLITVVEHLLPHADMELRRQLQAQLLVMRDAEAQEDMHRKAESLAQRWLAFDVALADSLLDGKATSEVLAFAFSLQSQWGADAQQLIRDHSLPDGGLLMTKPLALILEKARQNTLWTSAGVATGNSLVLNQLDNRTARDIYENDRLIDMMIASGYAAHEIAAIEARNNRIIAAQNVIVGGGCGGKVGGGFGGKADNTESFGNPLLEQEPQLAEDSSENDPAMWNWKTGVCRVESCHTRPGQTKVGPCAVCRGCQKLFDKGIDPTKRPAPRSRTAERQGSLYLLDLFKWDQELAVQDQRAVAT